MHHARLRAFHAVGTLGGFSAAAREIGVTQPALTVQVRALERDFGVLLFHRVNRGVRLTDTGESLLGLTRRYFGVESEIEDFLRSSGGFLTGQIRIAADGPYHVIPLLTTIRERMPNMEVNVSFGNSDDVLNELDTYEAHLGVSSTPEFDDRFSTLHRSEHAIVLMVPVEHPWASRKSIAISELATAQLIAREPGSSTRRVFEKALAQANVTPNIVLELGSREAVRVAVAANLGLGVVQEREFGEDARLVAIPFSGRPPLAEERLICLRERAETPLMRKLVAILASTD